MFVKSFERPDHIWKLIKELDGREYDDRLTYCKFRLSGSFNKNQRVQLGRLGDVAFYLARVLHPLSAQQVLGKHCAKMASRTERYLLFLTLCSALSQASYKMAFIFIAKT